MNQIRSILPDMVSIEVVKFVATNMSLIFSKLMAKYKEQAPNNPNNAFGKHLHGILHTSPNVQKKSIMMLLDCIDMQDYMTTPKAREQAIMHCVTKAQLLVNILLCNFYFTTFNNAFEKNDVVNDTENVPNHISNLVNISI